MVSRNLPIFLVFGAAFVIGVGVVIAAVATDDPDPVPTLSEFNAAQAAKSAYYQSDRTAEPANCNVKEWDSESDVWRVECVLEREDGTTEITQWHVTPDAVATRADGEPTSTPQAEARAR